MAIISASRRTDIPAFYTTWFMNRIDAGYALVPNPFNARQVRRVSLLPADVDCIVFWTKDPRPMLGRLDELRARGHRTIFHVTITGLGKMWEPRVPSVEEVADAVEALAEKLGPETIIWRFDPIVISSDLSVAAAVDSFAAIAGRLAGRVNRVVVSFARGYPRVKARLRRLNTAGELAPADKTLLLVPDLTRQLRAAADSSGIPIYSCADTLGLENYGILPGKCIDAEMISRVIGRKIILRKDSGQRGSCGCIQSIDIGIYGTCRHDCLYCYASTSSRLARSTHDEESPFLIDSGNP